MTQTVVLIDEGFAETITVEAIDDGAEEILNVTKLDYENGVAQVWGGKEEGAKGIRIVYCLGNLEVETLARACFTDNVWLHLHLTDAIDSVVDSYATNEGWTKRGLLSLAKQFDEFAARLRKAAR